MYKRIISGLILTLSVTQILSAQVYDPAALIADPTTAEGPLSPVLTGLGDYHFKVTTDNEQSQYFFDQGMRLVVGFNHSEALRSFKEAVRLDPNNAMAYWGWALALGRNLNIPMMMNSADQANHAINMASSLKDKVSERERDYIETLEARYDDDLSISRDILDQAYIEATEELMNKYPDDLDAAVLYVSAAMNAQPWDYWYLDGTPKGNTEKALAVLDSVIARDPNHSAALHYHIHITEFKKPWLAENSADALAPTMPGAGHLVHMPSHIYIRVGRYQDAYDINVKAVKVDEEYIEQTKRQSVYPLMYYPHNIHFLSWSSMFTGRSQNSIDAAMKVKAYLERGVRKTSWGSGNEYFRSQPIYVMVRFGKWDEILEMPKPFMKARFLTGMWHYGRSLAYLHTGEMEKAEAEMAELSKIAADFKAGLPGYNTEGLRIPRDTLIIGEQYVMGEVSAKKGDYDQAVYHLSNAVRLEDSDTYSEPPAWQFPTRHALGAILMEAGRVREAETVYWADLQHNPKNAYSYFGLYQSMLAQGKGELAAEYLALYEDAWKDSDVKLTSSRIK
tara:strand:- start:41792 stop:43477 length:1686 start_codon:yes stop_codon:yes gene_type:complete